MSRTISHDFKEDLRAVLNRHSIDNLLEMPDFVIAQFLDEFLCALARANSININWHGWPTLEEKLCD